MNILKKNEGGTQCCASNCRKRKRAKTSQLNRSDSEGSEDDESGIKRQFPRTFHSFPKKDQDKMERWVANINRKGWYPTASSLICSDYFLEKYINRNGNNVVLQAKAVPTRFKRSKGYFKRSKLSRPGPSTRKRTSIKNVPATVSAEDSLGQLTSLFSPTAAKIPKKTESQFDNQCFENKQPKTMSSFSAPRQEEQVLEAPVQVAKQKPVESPRQKQKKKIFVANHQLYVMSNLVSLWKSGKLCDASIGNGSSTVMMHKLVLSAMCPKLLSLSSMDIGSHEFLQVNFPSEVSKEALNTFAEYVYTGVLDLDPEILEQLKIIAKRLNMNEFERLCDSHLSNQLVPAVTSSVDMLANTQTNTPVSNMISSVDLPHSALTTSMLSASSTYTPVINIKLETCENRLARVEREDTMLSKETDVASLAPNVSGNAASFVDNPHVKAESIVSDYDKYSQRRNSNQSFASTTSSSLFLSEAAIATSTSIASVPSSSTEFDIPSSGATDIKSTRLKAPPLVLNSSPVSSPLCTQSSSMKKYSSKPSKSSLPFTIPKNSNAVFPVELFINRGDNLPSLTTESSDTMTDASCIPSEKT